MKKILGLNVFVGLMAAAGVAAIGLYIMHRYFGFLEYPSLSPIQIDKIAKEIDSRFKIVSRALQEDGTYRGIYDTGGMLYYYRYRPGIDYVLYPMLFERWTSERTLIDNVKLIYP